MTPYRVLVLGLLALVSVLGLIGWHLDRALHSEVRLASELANRGFTRLFVNQNWAKLHPLLMLGQPIEDVRQNPALDEIDSVVRQFARGTDLIRVKVFDARGVIVYSSDRELIGDNSAADSAGFLAAIKGEVSTKIVHKNTVSTFEGELSNLDTISSYVPIKGEMGTQAVVEVYTDRTTSMQALHRQWWQTLALIAGLMALLAAGWWWLYLKAHRASAQRQRMNDESQARLRAQVGQMEQAQREGCDAMHGMVQDVHDHLHRLLPAFRSGGSGDVSGVPPSGAALDAAQALEQQLSDFLYLAAIDRGEIRHQPHPFALGDLLRRMGGALEARCTQQQLGCVVFVAASADRMFLGDTEKIEKALSLLLDHALQQTAEGSIQLRADTTPEGVVLDVVDTGAGLSESWLAQGLKTPVGQPVRLQPLAAHDSSAPVPSDVSLVIVHKLAQVMGGELKVHSTLGNGSWMSIRLPLAPAGAPEEGDAS